MEQAAAFIVTQWISNHALRRLYSQAPHISDSKICLLVCCTRRQLVANVSVTMIVIASILSFLVLCLGPAAPLLSYRTLTDEVTVSLFSFSRSPLSALSSSPAVSCSTARTDLGYSSECWDQSAEPQLLRLTFTLVTAFCILAFVCSLLLVLTRLLELRFTWLDSCVLPLWWTGCGAAYALLALAAAIAVVDLWDRTLRTAGAVSSQLGSGGVLLAVGLPLSLLGWLGMFSVGCRLGVFRMQRICQLGVNNEKLVDSISTQPLRADTASAAYQSHGQTA